MRRVALLLVLLLLFASSVSAAPAPLPKPERRKEPEKLAKDQQQLLLLQTVELIPVQNVQVRRVLLRNAQQVPGNVVLLRVVPAVPAQALAPPPPPPPPAPPK